MLNVDDIKEYLKSNKRTFVSDVRLRPSDETILLYIAQDKIASKARSNVTSTRQLSVLKRHLKEKYSREVEVIFFQEEKQQELEAGFYQILNRKFKDQIISLYISFKDKDMVDAFIEVSNLDEQLQQDITEHFRTILAEANFTLGSFHWLSSPLDLPTMPALLRKLKTLQPLNIDRLTSELKNTYKSVSDKWLHNKLDKLRRQNFVIWQKSTETYVLTDDAIKIVPAGKSRSSSDIDRALALGRRKW